MAEAKTSASLAVESPAVREVPESESQRYPATLSIGSCDVCARAVIDGRCSHCGFASGK